MTGTRKKPWAFVGPLATVTPPASATVTVTPLWGAPWRLVTRTFRLPSVSGSGPVTGVRTRFAVALGSSVVRVTVVEFAWNPLADAVTAYPVDPPGIGTFVIE